MNRIYTIEEIKNISVPIAQKYGVEKLALFGSYARGEQKSTSDIDFLIELGNIRGLEFYSFILNLENEFGVNVDVLTYDTLKEPIYNDFVDKEVILYER